MLWKKTADDSIYIDLLHGSVYPIRNRRIYRNKCNSVAISLRNQGNKLYSEQKFEDAFVKYNESVCFSENNSESLALAYSNRSQCFLKMNMYDQCIGDVLLVKELQYPKILQSKLDARLKACELIKSVQQKPFRPTLSYEPHKEFNTMAHVLKIEYDNTYGRMVKAVCDIDVGQTVVIEEDYIRSTSSEYTKYCSYCGKTKTNFIPCKQCADATFCDKACAVKSSHHLECNLMFGSENICDQQSLTTILRSVLIGISSFDTINEFIKFVEDSLCASRHEISGTMECPKSKYRTFLQLASFVTDQRVLDFRKRAYFVREAINSSRYAYMFETVASQRFLAHLITYHGLILLSNSFAYEEDGTRFEELALNSSYFNHSCLPNAAKLTKNNWSVVKTIKPIKREEQHCLLLTLVARYST